MLKHINWRCGNLQGKIAIFFDEEDGYLEIQPIKGNNPLIGLLFNFLDIALAKNWREQAVNLFHQNEKPWRVSVRRGMSGCQTFRMIRLLDERLLIIKNTATVHVSMFEKFKSIKGFIGELAPIFERILEVYPVADIKEIEPDVYEGYLEGEWVRLEIAKLPRDDFHHPLVKLHLKKEPQEPQEPEVVPQVPQVPEIEVI